MFKWENNVAVPSADQQWLYWKFFIFENRVVKTYNRHPTGLNAGLLPVNVRVLTRANANCKWEIYWKRAVWVRVFGWFFSLHWLHGKRNMMTHTNKANKYTGRSKSMGIKLHFDELKFNVIWNNSISAYKFPLTANANQAKQTEFFWFEDFFLSSR